MSLTACSMVPGWDHHSRKQAVNHPRDHHRFTQTHPEDEVVLHFGLDGRVVDMERRQLLQRGAAGSAPQVRRGLRRREGHLDPLLGVRRVEDGSAGALGLHRVVELEHDAAELPHTIKGDGGLREPQTAP